MRRSERRNNLQICQRPDSNTGGSDLWSSTLPLDHGGAPVLSYKIVYSDFSLCELANIKRTRFLSPDRNDHAIFNDKHIEILLCQCGLRMLRGITKLNRAVINRIK